MLFRRSTGRQRHLVPSPTSPPFAVLVSRLTSICYVAVLYVTHSAFEDSLSGTGGSVLSVQCDSLLAEVLPSKWNTEPVAESRLKFAADRSSQSFG